MVIHTTRQYPEVWDWLLKHGLADYITGITNTKVPAVAYIDDRAICHQGDFEQTLVILENFKPHWKE